MADKSRTSSLRLTLYYTVFAAAWILFSDLAVESLFPDSADMARIQTYKGWFFVFITGLLLYILVLRNNRRIEQLFQLDGLTGLLNHLMFKKQLERRIAAAAKNAGLIVGYLDIDDFKKLNQTLGYERADQFIVQLAEDIERSAHQDSIIGRLPPDQFLIAHEFAANEDIDAHIRGYQSIFNQCAKKFGVDATCSLGVAIYPDDGDSAKSLMNAVTEALRIAKQSGNAVQYHDKSLTDIAARRRQLEEDLKAAIADRAFTVVYQPKYVLDTLRVSGVEVLIRWQHPINGFVSPAEFIPLAEECGMAHAITQLVIDKASAELEQSGLLRTTLKHVAINVSAAEFNQPDDMDDLLCCIKSHAALAPCVRIEITETAMLNDMQQSASIIRKLRDEGVSISIDDFGTGYSSLAMLKDFAVDEIKIDRSFVSALEEGGRAKTIVGAIIAMADSFAINVVAEGVETPAQLDALKAMGCREVQGFYLGKPMTIDALLQHLAP